MFSAPTLWISAEMRSPTSRKVPVITPVPPGGYTRIGYPKLIYPHY
jgi:hypothetical protein